MRGANTHRVALPTSCNEYVAELVRRVNETAEKHKEDPDWLRNLNPKGPEFMRCLKALRGWEAPKKIKNFAKTKALLVKALVTSGDLMVVIEEVRKKCKGSGNICVRS